ncbi:MAG: aminotransferase class IV, partial [Cycloclasticus sp.]|nr:aminotransferase class IV [Cycloclasticus sp.]
LARKELGDGALSEGLMLDVNGVVIEGTMSNIFIVSNDVLMTPKLNNAGVLGVIRNYLIQQAGKEGIDCREVDLSLENLKNADEIFMTNSLMPVRAIKQLKIGEVVFPKEVGAYANWALSTVLADIQQQVYGQAAQ